MSHDVEPAFIPSVFYEDPKAALAWLERAFGFETTMLIESPDGDVRMMHSEMRYLDGTLNVGAEWEDAIKSPRSLGGSNTQRIRVRVDADIDAHFARARDAGAVVVQEPSDEFYGARTYRVRDPEGHTWTFSQPIKSMTIPEMEAAGGLVFKSSR
jgi:uncharacterized glyoxalase superfamily protein PhnB